MERDILGRREVENEMNQENVRRSAVVVVDGGRVAGHIKRRQQRAVRCQRAAVVTVHRAWLFVHGRLAMVRLVRILRLRVPTLRLGAR